MDIGADAIQEITVNVWSAMFDAELVPIDPARAVFGIGALTGVVGITGAWTGAVAVTCPEEVARKLAAKMFDMPEGDISADELRDALGEVANMCGGNFKALVPHPSKLSLPTVTSVKDDTGGIPEGRVLHRLGFEYDGGRIAVAVVSNEPA